MCRRERASITRRTLDELLPEITPGQKQLLADYTALLLEGLKKQRLVGETTEKGIIQKHIYDSLYPLTVCVQVFDSVSLLDLGTGAGLPGIPLKICRPSSKLYLMDSNRRKINFLRRTVDRLGLQQVEFLHGRAEEFGRNENYRGSLSLIVSRAVAPAAILAELALPLLTEKGILLLYKGRRGDEEAFQAAGAISRLGGKLERNWEYRLPTGEARTLLLFKKIVPTPQAYPRSPGRPAKKPLR